MSKFLCSDNYYETRRGTRTICARADIPVETILDALTRPGEVLKDSPKAAVRRVGRSVIKESRAGFPLGLIRHTFQRNRYRRAWLASFLLRSGGVRVPEPLAYIESGFLGLVSGNVMVSEYLAGYRNVEQYMAALTQHGAAKDTLDDFLAGLAEAVNRFCATGAVHTDLSGKNIFTLDGRSFCFIDLDAVTLNAPYTDEMRMRNHVQLYDSFCDLLSDTLLVPFLERMLTAEHDSRVWMPAVRKAQAERRLRTEALREKRGVR
jgi:hypothetical protein